MKKVARAYPRRQLHFVVDNYHTHKHPEVQAWLANNPRITLHFTPTSGSWLNLVRGLLHNHHQAGDPARDLRQRQGTHRRDQPLHRRLERTMRAVHLDQDRRPNPAARPAANKFRRGTLAAASPQGAAVRGPGVVERSPAQASKHSTMDGRRSSAYTACHSCSAVPDSAHARADHRT